jgi:hypothetical protein
VGQYPAFFDLFVEIPGTGAILELTSTRLDIPNVNISEYDLIFLYSCWDSERHLFPSSRRAWKVCRCSGAGRV